MGIAWLAAAALQASAITGEKVQACVSLMAEERWLPSAEMDVVITTGEHLNQYVGRAKYRATQHYAVLSLGEQGRLALPLAVPNLGGLPQEVEEEEHPTRWRLSLTGELGCDP